MSSATITGDSSILCAPACWCWNKVMPFFRLGDNNLLASLIRLALSASSADSFSSNSTDAASRTASGNREASALISADKNRHLFVFLSNEPLNSGFAFKALDVKDELLTHNLLRSWVIRTVSSSVTFMDWIPVHFASGSAAIKRSFEDNGNNHVFVVWSNPRCTPSDSASNLTAVIALGFNGNDTRSRSPTSSIFHGRSSGRTLATPWISWLIAGSGISARANKSRSPHRARW